MSLHPLTPQYVQKIIGNRISEVKGEIEGQVDKNYLELVHASFKFLEDQFQGEQTSGSPLAERKIKEIQEQEVILVFDPLLPLAGQTQKLASLINVDLHQVVDSYHDLQKNSAEILEKGMTPFLNEKWAENFLLYCLQQGENWAAETLNSLVLNPETQVCVFEMLFCHFENYPVLLRLLKQQAGQANFQEYLKSELLKEHPSPHALNTFFYLCLKNLGQDWTKLVLEDFFKREQLDVALNYMLKSLDTGVPLYANLAKLIVEKFIQGEKTCLKVLILFFSRVLDEANLLLLFDLILQFLPKESPKLTQMFCILFYNQFQIEDHVLNNRFKSWIEKAIAQEEKVWFEKVKARAFSLYAKCSFLETMEKDPLYDFQIKMLILDREESLRDLLLNPKDSYIGDAKKIRTCFPKTRAILVGSSADPAAEEFTTHIASDLNGFLNQYSIQIIQAPYSNDKNDSREFQRIDLEDCGIDQWVQDTVHFLTKNDRLHIAVPNFLIANLPNETLISSREDRMQALKPEEFCKPNYSCLGVSLETGVHEYLLKLAQKVNKLEDCTRIQLSYIEGGNMLSGAFDQGDKAGQPFLIIGYDSVEYTRLVLQEELQNLSFHREDGRWTENFEKPPEFLNLLDEEIKQILSFDFGVPPENIFFVEQPYSFHLDTRMALIGGNRVMLNNSTEALEMSLRIYESKGKNRKNEITQATEHARAVDQYELLVQKQLEDQGFEVIRVPGAFTNYYEDEPELHQANFFNFISMESPCESKKNIIVALGAHPKLQDEFASLVQRHFKVEISDVFYLNVTDSQSLLSCSAGIRCLTQRLEHLLVE